jgi:hypothetical protein
VGARGAPGGAASASWGCRYRAALGHQQHACFPPAQEIARGCPRRLRTAPPAVMLSPGDVQPQQRPGRLRHIAQVVQLLDQAVEDFMP